MNETILETRRNTICRDDGDKDLQLENNINKSQKIIKIKKKKDKLITNKKKKKKRLSWC